MFFRTAVIGAYIWPMTVDYMMQRMCENNSDGNVAIFHLDNRKLCV